MNPPLKADETLTDSPRERSDLTTSAVTTSAVTTSAVTTNEYTLERKALLQTRFGVFVAIFTPSLLLVAALAWVLYGSVEPAMRHQLVQAARQPALATARNIQSNLPNEDVGQAPLSSASPVSLVALQQSTLLSWQAFQGQNLAFLVVTDETGQPLGIGSWFEDATQATEDDQFQASLQDIAAQAAALGDTIENDRLTGVNLPPKAVTYGEMHIEMVAEPVVRSGQTLGAVVVGVYRDELDQDVRSIVQNALTTSLLPLLMAFVVAAVLGRRLAATYHDMHVMNGKLEVQAIELQRQTFEDSLTGLHNRRHMNMRLEQEFSRSKRYQRPLSLAVLDIDFFKRVNDLHGHAVGDEVLRHFSALLKESMRDTDYLARYGGEEFVVAFIETPLPQAREVCERFRQHVATFAWHNVHEGLKVTVSIGVTDGRDKVSLEGFIDAADNHLYEAKEHGRNQVVSG